MHTHTHTHTLYFHSRFDALLKPAGLTPVPHVLAHCTASRELALIVLVHLHCASEETLARFTANDSIVPSIGNS